MMGRIRRNVVFYLFNFEPRPLAIVTRQRLAALVGDTPVITHAHANRDALVMEVQQHLRRKGTEVRGGGTVLPFASVVDTLEEAGLRSRDAQLQWVALTEVRGGGTVLPFACVVDTLEEAGLRSRDAQLQWA